MDDNDIVSKLEKALGPKARKRNNGVKISTKGCYIKGQGKKARAQFHVEVGEKDRQSWLDLPEFLDLLDDMLNALRRNLTGETREKRHGLKKISN